MSSADENRGAGALAVEAKQALQRAWGVPGTYYADNSPAQRAALASWVQNYGDRLIAAARAATTTAQPAPPDAWTCRFRNGGEVLWTYTRKTLEEVRLATRGEHEDRFEFAPLYLAEAGGEGLREALEPFRKEAERHLRLSPNARDEQVTRPTITAGEHRALLSALSAHPAKQPSAGVAAGGLTERASGVEGEA